MSYIECFEVKLFTDFLPSAIKWLFINTYKTKLYRKNCLDVVVDSEIGIDTVRYVKSCKMFDGPGVAVAVLQSALCLRD